MKLRVNAHQVLSTAVAVAVVLLAGGTAMASAPSTPSPLTGPNVIMFPKALDLAPFTLSNPVMHILQGQAENGACHLVLSQTAAVGAGPVGAVATAFDPTNCLYQVEEGPATNLQYPATEVLTPSSGDPSASVQTGFHDPVYINVNWVQTNLTWAENGSTVTSYSGSATNWELGADGWQLDGWSQGGGNNGSYAYYSATANFYNGYFCPTLFGGGITDTWYEPTEIQGHANGTASYSANFWASGGCESMLTPWTIFNP